MKLLNKIILIAAVALLSVPTYAQEEEAPEPTFGISGSVDTYFRSTEYAPYTSFANLNGFALGMANVIMSYDGDKVGFVADLVFGPRGAEAVFGSNPALNIVNQLNAYINVTDNFKLTLGNFNTFLGYEVISPTANFNYSTSYMFSYGPFSHSGIKADFALGESFSLVVALMNPTDATDFNPVNEYVTGLQLGYSAGSGSAYLNVLASDKFFQIDLTLSLIHISEPTRPY